MTQASIHLLVCCKISLVGLNCNRSNYSSKWNKSVIDKFFTCDFLQSIDLHIPSVTKKSQPETSTNNNSVNDEALDLADDDEAGPNNNVDTDLMVWSLRPKSGSSIEQLCPPLHIVQTACQRGQAVLRCSSVTSSQHHSHHHSQAAGGGYQPGNNQHDAKNTETNICLCSYQGSRKPPVQSSSADQQTSYLDLASRWRVRGCCWETRDKQLSMSRIVFSPGEYNIT